MPNLTDDDLKTSAKIDQTSVRQKRIRAIAPILIENTLKAALVFAAVDAYFASNILESADATALYDLGGKLACFAALTYFTAKTPNRHWLIIAISCTICAILLVLFFRAGFEVEAVALDNAAENDARCLALQNDMLSAYPRRKDSVALFQALRCDPQGAGNVYAPPRNIG